MVDNSLDKTYDNVVCLARNGWEVVNVMCPFCREAEAAASAFVQSERATMHIGHCGSPECTEAAQQLVVAKNTVVRPIGIDEEFQVGSE